MTHALGRRHGARGARQTSSACRSASRTSTTSSPTCARRSTSTADPAAPRSHDDPRGRLRLDLHQGLRCSPTTARCCGTASTPTTGTQGPGWRHPRRLPRPARRASRCRMTAHVHACSSAGGGLRLAVVGYERTVTAQAGHRVGLSAGAKVVHVADGALTTADGERHTRMLVPTSSCSSAAPTAATRMSCCTTLPVSPRAPSADTASTRCRSSWPATSTLATQAAALLEAAGRPMVLADNVLPQIGVIAPESARAAIREAFLRHVIGGKGLSRDPAFGRWSRPPTPDVVLRGVEVARGRARRRGRPRRRHRWRDDRRLLVPDPGGRGRQPAQGRRRAALARPHRRGRPRHALERRARRRGRRGRAACSTRPP